MWLFVPAVVATVDGSNILKTTQRMAQTAQIERGLRKMALAEEERLIGRKQAVPTGRQKMILAGERSIVVT
jgi:hypothetical protein